MAGEKLCPLKAGVVQGVLQHMRAEMPPMPIDYGKSWGPKEEEYIRGELATIKEYAQEEFGMCDCEKCAMWVPTGGRRYTKGHCGLINEYDKGDIIRPDEEEEE